MRGNRSTDSGPAPAARRGWKIPRFCAAVAALLVGPPCGGPSVSEGVHAFAARTTRASAGGRGGGEDHHDDQSNHKHKHKHERNDQPNSEAARDQGLPLRERRLPPTRRGFLRDATAAAVVASPGLSAWPVAPGEAPPVLGYTSPGPGGGPPSLLTVPLASTGRELLVAYSVDGSPFKAVLDTGSPFLMIPGSCGANTRRKSGCYRNQGRPVPSLEPTIEIFDGFEGEVEWRSAPFGFLDIAGAGANANATASPVPLLPPNPDPSSPSPPEPTPSGEVVFGVASESIMGGPGGVFFGMIRDTDARIRPSFLGQTDASAFRIDLASRPRTLTLSRTALLGAAPDRIPTTDLLRRRYGDPVGHYTARAKSVVVDGVPLAETASGKGTKIFVIFDTGVTGMVVSRGLFDERYLQARRQRSKTLFGRVELAFETEGGREVTLAANKPLTTPFDPERTWKRFPKRREGRKANVHIIVMGLAFLDDRVLTVDIDEQRLWVA